MIPTYRTPLTDTRPLKAREIPSKTFEIDWENNRLLSRHIDGAAAVGQAVQVITAIEWRDFVVMPDWFGFEIKRYLGMPRPFVKANLERLVKEALSTDDRIEKITDFRMTDLPDHAVLCEFTTVTKEGAFDAKVRVGDV